MIKIIASDLDKTLLNNKHELSETTKKTINSFLDSGTLFIPCTARPINEIPIFFHHELIPYWICENGAIIYNHRTKEYIIKREISFIEGVNLICDNEHFNPYWTVFINGIVYSNRKIIDDASRLGITDGYLDFIINSRIFVESVEELPNQPITKIHYVAADFDKRAIFYDHLQKQHPKLNVSSSSHLNIEISHESASKGLSLQYLTKSLDINQDEVIIFGDNDNDISMFELFENNVAVANATNIILNKAKFVTTSNDEDGVAKYIIENIL